MKKTKQEEQNRASSKDESAKKREFNHAGQMLSFSSHEINCALDVRVARQVSPELTGMRGRVLGLIVRHIRQGKAVYQRDLETWFHIGRSSVTTMLQGMEQAGFILREPVERDARLKSLVPTEKGLECAGRLANCIDRFEGDLQNGITCEEMSSLQSILEKMLANAQQIRNEK